MSMQRSINVLFDGSHYTFRWLKALAIAREAFAARGFTVRFPDAQAFRPFDPAALLHRLRRERFDILLLAYHHTSAFFRDLTPADRAAILTLARERSRCLIWLDTADSTGTCRFEVLPYVHRYLKKQLLTDTARYLAPIWGGRVHCDHYHRQLSLADPALEADAFTPLEPRFQHKLGVAWNVALGDLFAHGGLQYLTPLWRKRPRFVAPDAPRPLDVHFRGSAWSPIAGYQRARCKELLLRRTDLAFPDPTAKVPRRVYRQELMHARTVLSPFGWGEICGRDMECFAYGAALLKPDMAHLTTYPALYQSGETYLPFDWDFTDFDALLDTVLAHPERIARIAANGQAMLREAYAPVGRQAFADHLLRAFSLPE